MTKKSWIIAAMPSMIYKVYIFTGSKPIYKYEPNATWINVTASNGEELTV